MSTESVIAVREDGLFAAACRQRHKSFLFYIMGFKLLKIGILAISLLVKPLKK